MIDVRSWLSPEARFICAAASFAAETEAVFPVDLDPAVFLDALRRHRLELSVGRRIAAMAGLPAGAAERTGACVKNAVMRAMERATTTIRATEALRQAGIEVLAFKGCVLSQQLYGDPFQRASSDVDLLIRPQARAAAAATLQDMGYRPVRSVPDWLDDGAEISFFPKGSGAAIDLHVRLAHSEAQCPLSVLRPFDRAVDVMIGGTVVRTFSPDIGLAYLALHATKHFCRKLGWLYDIAMAARVWPESWPAALVLSERIGAERRLLLTALLARQLFAAPPVDAGRGKPDAVAWALSDLAPILSGPPPIDDLDAKRRIGLWRALWWDLRLTSALAPRIGVMADRLKPRSADIGDARPFYGVRSSLYLKKAFRLVSSRFAPPRE